jgi:hypothetical protein
VTSLRVRLQIEFGVEDFGTKFTLERFHTSVRRHVIVETVFSSECLSTDVTFEGRLFMVQLQMRIKR